MNINNVILFYKKSAYEIYFLKNKNTFSFATAADKKYLLGRFKRAHDLHHSSLDAIKAILKEKGISFTMCLRGRPKTKFPKDHFIISLGGDGTLLEACRLINHQPVLGVNTAPEMSVGKLCCAKSENFSDTIDRIRSDTLRPTAVRRGSLKVTGVKGPLDFINDILICHANPASLSRYNISIGKRSENQRSSGLWVATPAGSTGAIYSAGGRKMPIKTEGFQYKPRELYHISGAEYILTGGILDDKSCITVISHMRNGKIFIDGSHVNIPFRYGAKAVISLRKNFVNLFI